MMAILGFTGTRAGMTKAQQVQVRALFLVATELHHGDCVGADAQAHAIARKLRGELGYSGAIFIVARPGPSGPLRANCRADCIMPVKDYHARNRDIVDACELLVAAPREATEQPKGGTWWTVRYARSIGRRVVLVLPDGTVQG